MQIVDWVARSGVSERIKEAVNDLKKNRKSIRGNLGVNTDLLIPNQGKSNRTGSIRAYSHDQGIK
jgi:hypothetical protein